MRRMRPLSHRPVSVSGACLCWLTLAASACAEAGTLGDFLGVPCPLPRGLCLADVVGAPDAHAGSVREALFVAKGEGDPLPLNESLVYARSLLQQAVEVEHSTIPLYLTSLYSIANGSSYAATTLHSVVIEEMLHILVESVTLGCGVPTL